MSAMTLAQVGGGAGVSPQKVIWEGIKELGDGSGLVQRSRGHIQETVPGEINREYEVEADSLANGGHEGV